MVIAQQTIATTPKYNFPHPTTDTILPQRFTDLSLHSLKDRIFQLNQQDFQQVNYSEPFRQQIQFKPEAIALKPRCDGNIVAAVDTSTIKIGETSAGILIAVRGANVWKQQRNFRYVRFGPFIFHITDANKNNVYNDLQKSRFDVHYENARGFPNLLQMPMRIASLLERWLQNVLSKTVSDGEILVDGSLTAGTADAPVSHMKEILASARKRNTTVLAFSKMSNLRMNGCLITELDFKQQKPPCLLESFGFRPRPPIVLLGDVYVARLSRGGYAFRLDIDREVGPAQRISAVEAVLGNDLVRDGYPETLRLAHILCTFTGNEVIAMQHFATHSCGLRIIERPDMHKILFGPFGRGENCS